MEIFFHISWRRSSSPGGSCTATTIQNGQLIGSGSLTCHSGCSGAVSTMQYKCTDFSTTEDWSYGERKIFYTFPSSESITIGFSGCCWISPFSNSWNLISKFSMVPRNDTGVINSTPRATTSPVIRLQSGCNHTIEIPVTDPDEDDIVRCRWATGVECSGICNRIPGAVLDSASCTITYEANNGLGYKGVALTIEDFRADNLMIPLSEVGLQFLVYVFYSDQPCSTSPVFRLPTIRNQVCVAVAPNDTFTTQVIADSHSSDTSISEIVTISPSGTIKGDLDQTENSNLYYVNISWTPSIVQQGQTHLFCYTAINSNGLSSEQSCIKIHPGIFPPEPNGASISPANSELVHPSNTTWSIQFDKTIQRPTVTSFIKFQSVSDDEVFYKIDVSLSNEVSFNQSDKILITPTFNFPERQLFYITFERGVVNGIEECGPASEPINKKDFWTFETLDVTPPEINFIQQPTITNTNVSIAWTSNENVTWHCTLTDHLKQKTVVNCNDGSWVGLNLLEGEHILQIKATDEYGNKATVTHTFEVDLTPPIVVFTLRPTELDNAQTALFKFKCNEACSMLDCLFSSDEYIPCNSGIYTTPALEHNTTYNISVRGIDLVGNKGNWTYYNWMTDFKPPNIYGIIDTNISCTAEATPENTGQALASDDITGQPKMSYVDYKTSCFIRRTWSAEDEAGNIATLIQIITLNFSPTISLAPVYFQPCDSANNVIDVTVNTASALNPCKRSLDLTYEDSTSVFTCPGNLTRSWTVIDECTQVNQSSSQSIILYDICPSHACGRNESIPRGTCIFGECTCFKPWYEENCDELIYEPVIENIINIIVHEGESYMQAIDVTQGTPPLAWSLVSGPSYFSVDVKTGEVNWLFPTAGNHSISVQVQNTVGTAIVEWSIHVKRGYTVVLDPVSPLIYPKAVPIVLTGHVEYADGNVVKDTLSGIVSVHIDIFDDGVERTVKTFTENDGSFTAVFYPAPTEFGAYTCSARHPQSSSAAKQSEWFLLGMSASPQAVSLDASTVNVLKKTFFNVSVLTNNGPLPLYGLSYTAGIQNIPNLNVQMKFGSSVDILQPGSSLAIDIIIESGPINAVFTITVETLNGTVLYLPVNLQIRQIVPVLSTDPTFLKARVIRGSSKIFTFNVTNIGIIAANTVKAVLPLTSFISLVSFGNEEQPEGDLLLENGQSATLSVLVKTSPEQQLGELSGDMLISADETFVKIPFSLLISSDVNMNLTIAVEDEYTYFAASKPLVNGAIVHLINYQRNIDFMLVTENGTVTFFNISEDRYELLIDGPNHQTSKQVIVTDINSPMIAVFILRSAVTYSWTVTPVTFEDTYKISLEADFETHVPIPVVTVTPREIDLEALELGSIDSFQLNVTNHGLIRAENLRIDFPNHPFLYLTTAVETLGDLEALSSVIIGVEVTRKERRRAIVQSVVYIAYALDVYFQYVCGDLIEKRIQVQMLRKEYRFHEISDVISRPRCSGGCGISGSGSGGSYYYDGNGAGSRTSASFIPISASTPVFCNKCLQTVVSCIPSLTFGRVNLFPGAPCIPTIASGSFSIIPKDSIISGVLGHISCALSFTKKFSKLNIGVSLAKCLLDTYDNCITPYISKKRSLKATIPTVIEGLYTANLSNSLMIEIFGNDLWINIPADPDWFNYVLWPTFDDESDNGLLVSQTELVIIQNTSLPSGTTTDNVVKLVERLNNTLYGWNHGELEPTNGSNMISFNAYNDMSREINFYNDKAKENGYESYLDAYNSAVDDTNSIEDIESESGVCAVVRIRIEQELAITREAFMA